MKRTRRVEIIRYSSHVTSGDGGDATDAETLTLDLLLQALIATPHTSEEVQESQRAATGIRPPRARGFVLRLPGWLRKG